ncbi:hypothetical protein KIN20_033267 [Parelaphostrongylus tenuis]|uniref:CC2D2A N-terminal C2 domain-containing protein n=1 Tax=Parelaphostrongylus tenuis TaxID=148309 RepID=A0AAD5WIM7_PARTN|nr:hypothetical protein KIN20_033267 [Parelaphostrongylus tenuis]
MENENVLYNYVKAEDWKTFLDKYERNDYVQLDLFLGVIYFEHHPLIGDELLVAFKDKIDLRLRVRYNEQCQRINDMTDLLMHTENILISKNAYDNREHAEVLYNDVRKIAGELLSGYAELENCRNRQGYTISPLKYSLNENDENRTILGKLTTDNPVTPLGALPNDERKRIESIRQKSIQVELYFNDIIICKSRTMPLEGFYYQFEQLYNLEIVSEPKTIHITILEKQGTDKRNIAKVNIPLPDDDETTKDCRPPHRISFESSDKTVAGLLFARASWSLESKTTRHREKGSPAKCIRDQPFALIPPEVRLVSDEEFESNSRWDALEKRFQKRSGVGRSTFATITVKFIINSQTASFAMYIYEVACADYTLICPTVILLLARVKAILNASK